MRILTENDYKIMSRFINLKALSKTTGITRKVLTEATGLSYTKVRSGVNALIEYGFIDIGIAKGREMTYFITEKGTIELKTIAESSINIKGEN